MSHLKKLLMASAVASSLMQPVLAYDISDLESTQIYSDMGDGRWLAMPYDKSDMELLKSGFSDRYVNAYFNFVNVHQWDSGQGETRLEREAGDVIYKRHMSYKKKAYGGDYDSRPDYTYQYYYAYPLTKYLKTVGMNRYTGKGSLLHRQYAPGTSASESQFFADFWPVQQFAISFKHMKPATNAQRSHTFSQSSIFGLPVRTMLNTSAWPHLKVEYGAYGAKDIDDFAVFAKEQYRKAKKKIDFRNAYESCDAQDISAVVWAETGIASFVHPVMFRSIKKAELSNIHDYSLNLASYVDGRKLYVANLSAKRRLEKKLDMLGVSAQVVVGADEDNRIVPFTSDHFAVARFHSEKPNRSNDPWGYSSFLAPYQNVRFAKIEDVRFEKDRKPIDAFFAEIAAERGVDVCSQSLI